MDTKTLKNIFLSASIPVPGREFYGTADVIAIRDAVQSLVVAMLPEYRIIWGGHPAITPLICEVLKKMGVSVQDYLILYQSQIFRNDFPIENKNFAHVILTDRVDDNKTKSLELMRNTMIRQPFEFAVFIGGMQGVLDEYQLFITMHPRALAIPIPTTGAAAKQLYDQNKESIPIKDLGDDYAYLALFQRIKKMVQP